MRDSQALYVSILWNGRCKRSYGTVVSGAQGSPSFTLVLPHSLLLVYLTLSMGEITGLDGVQQGILRCLGRVLSYLSCSLLEQYDSLAQRLPHRCRGGNQHHLALDIGSEAPGSVERPPLWWVLSPSGSFCPEIEEGSARIVCMHMCACTWLCASLSRRSCSDFFRLGTPHS